MKKNLLAATLACIAFGANAATLSFQFGIPIIEEVTEINQSGYLGLFDSALGTLTGVSLTAYGAGTTDITLTNNAVQAQSAKATSTVELHFSSSDEALVSIFGNTNPFITLIFGADLAPQSINSGESVSTGTLHDTKERSINSADYAGLLDLQLAGGGEFLVSCTSLTGISILGGGGNISSSQETTAGCGMAITYTYDATPTSNEAPEPGALALLALGLAGLGALRRRKA